MDETKKPENGVEINEGTFIGSQYAQAVNVTVTDIDITIQFIFINPRGGKKAQVVSRVTMPRGAALNLAELLINLSEQHAKKKKGETNG